MPRPSSRIFRIFSTLLHTLLELGITIFAWLWRFILWFWGAIIISALLEGSIGNAVYSYITTGKVDHIDFKELSLVQIIQSHLFLASIIFILVVVLSLLSYSASKVKLRELRINDVSEYGLKQVNRLDPNNYKIFHYIEQIYLFRDADTAARKVLHEIANQDTQTHELRQLGICVFGRSTQGKTRLAWEAMQAELSTWTFVIWPHDRQHPFPFTSLGGRRIVLWIDDLHEFANLNEAPAINDLPRLFAESNTKFAIIATCREGQDEVQTRKHLSGFLERLTEVRPSDISQEQAIKLSDALEQYGIIAQSTQFDGTPGSLLLGVKRMRDQCYPKLSMGARSLLKAMKLLRSAGIYTYTETRVRTTAVSLFNLDSQDWRDACSMLVSEHFVRLGPLSLNNERTIEPVADIYLEECILDYPIVGADIADDWLELQKGLMRQGDAAGLNDLGATFFERQRGNLLFNKQQAEICFRAALQIYVREKYPTDWAITQYNLGNALREQGDITEGKVQLDLYKQAGEAYKAALQVYTLEGHPAYWAITQNNLAAVLSKQARCAKGRLQSNLLKQSEKIYRMVLQVFKRDLVPYEWALTQLNLGVVLTDRGRLTEGPAQLALFKEAKEGYQAALSVLKREQHAVDWAWAQHNLGNLVREQARLEGGSERLELLKQAEEAYRAALSILTRECNPHDWALTQECLANVLFEQVEFADEATKPELLKLIAEVHCSVLKIYTREQFPDSWAATQINLGNVFREQARLAQGIAMRLSLLEDAANAYQFALYVFTRENDPIRWAMVQYNLGNVFGDQAQLTEGTERSNLLRQAVRSYRSALQIFTRKYTPNEWMATQNNLSTALRDQAELVKGEEQLALLKDAAVAYQALLTVYSEQLAPDRWAKVQHKLGDTLHQLAQLKTGVERIDSLKQALEAYQSALKIFTVEYNPIQYAMIQWNLGKIFETQVEYAEEAELLKLLTQAKEAYYAFLQIITPQNLPLEWGMTPLAWARTRRDLGEVLYKLIWRAEEDAQPGLLKQAIEAHEASLQIFTYEKYRSYWIETTFNLAPLYAAKASIEGDEALKCQLLISAYHCLEQVWQDIPKKDVNVYQRAIELRNRIKHQMQEAGCIA